MQLSIKVFKILQEQRIELAHKNALMKQIVEQRIKFLRAFVEILGSVLNEKSIMLTVEHLG